MVSTPAQHIRNEPSLAKATENRPAADGESRRTPGMCLRGRNRGKMPCCMSHNWSLMLANHSENLDLPSPPALREDVGVGRLAPRDRKGLSRCWGHTAINWGGNQKHVQLVHQTFPRFQSFQCLLQSVSPIPCHLHFIYLIFF